MIRLRFVVGERGRGAEGGEKRLANRSRRATPAPSHRRKPAAIAAICGCVLVTSARFRKARQAKRDERSPARRLKRALVTAETASFDEHQLFIVVLAD